MSSEFTLRWLTESALLVELDLPPGDQATDRLTTLVSRLDERAHPAIRDLIPAYTTLLVELHPDLVEPATLADWLTAEFHQSLTEAAEPPVARLVTIAVRYGGKDGPDLPLVARLTGFSPAEVVARHSTNPYRVAFLGFSPGFAYLSGLPPELAVPRRDTPRTRVPKGSVAIGGTQTGVYPQETPGGWHLIGRTSQPLFAPEAAEPFALRPGDRLQFLPVEPLPR